MPSRATAATIAVTPKKKKHTLHDKPFLSNIQTEKKSDQRTPPHTTLLNKVLPKRTKRSRLRLSHLPACYPPHKALLAQIRILAPQVLHLGRRVGDAGDFVGVEAESETADVYVTAIAGVGGACDVRSSANTANLF